MKKLVIVKYAAEIFLKGLNKNKFEKKLKDNMRKALAGMEFEFITDQGRCFIYSDDLQELINRLKKVFGIAELCIVTEIESSIENINVEALKALNESGAKTFKVDTNRANKDFPMGSMEINKTVGSYILDNSQGYSVDVRNPECRINVEIRGKTYIYSKRVKGIGGMPYGTNGKTLLMLSGGIDSPVAGYMMARRGVDLSCVYYHSHPYTSERAKDKVKELARILKGYTGSVTLYVVPFTNIQMGIMDKCREDELTIIMRRYMMRIACKIADKFGIESVATGESIGQVASQTMEGLVVSDDAADRPAFRPLIAFDKIDIMDLARKIGTYETSILPYEDCCTIFVAKHPKIRPVLSEIIKAESVMEIDKLVDEAIENMETFKEEI